MGERTNGPSSSALFDVDCHDYSKLTLPSVLLLTRIPPMLADFIVISITVVRTFKLRQQAGRIHRRSPLADCLLRGGKHTISSNFWDTPMIHISVRCTLLHVRCYNFSSRNAPPNITKSA